MGFKLITMIMSLNLRIYTQQIVNIYGTDSEFVLYCLNKYVNIFQIRVNFRQGYSHLRNMF